MSVKFFKVESRWDGVVGNLPKQNRGSWNQEDTREKQAICHAEPRKDQELEAMATIDMWGRNRSSVATDPIPTIAEEQHCQTGI